MNGLIILANNFLSAWAGLVEVVWPFVGLVFGVAVCFAWTFRSSPTASYPFKLLLLAAPIFQPGLYGLGVYLSEDLPDDSFKLGDYHIWAFCVGTVVAIGLWWAACRYLGSAFDRLTHGLTRRSSLERNRRTDIRQIAAHLPNPQKKYDPRKWFDKRKGIFFGLDERGKPVYLEWTNWQKSHIDIVGTTGAGKGVAAGVLLMQAILNGEAVIVLDPKFDEFLPYVLYLAAKQAGVPYVFIDLCGDEAQWNPLFGKTSYEIEELLNAGFSLGERGTDADFYRLDDRRASRIFAGNLPDKRPTLAAAHRDLVANEPQLFESAKKFVSDLEEIALARVTGIETGIDIRSLIAQGGVIYVRGSMRNPRVVKLQRMFLLSAMQFIERRDRDLSRHVCLFLDEGKYWVAKATLEAIGTLRGKNGKVVLAHQSLGDLRDCPADLDPEAVVSSVNENCAVKIAYAVKDPDTADWLARMSGHILVDDEIREMKTNAGLAETRENGRSLRQAERPLIDTNMLHALPERCAVLYGVGLARCFFTSPVPVTKVPAATTPWKAAQVEEGTRTKCDQPNQPTIARSLLDVD